jgi:L-ascorbate metabolism protein UlaG (beta-lactamase superfamily)
MINFTKMAGVILIIAVSLTAFGLVSFFQFAPQIGAKPDGSRMNRMLSAENYKSGKFHNTVKTKMDMKSGKMINVMWEFLRGNANREPVNTINAKKFNSEQFLKSNKEQFTFTWFGHSSLLFRIDEKVILVDPVFSKRASMFNFMGPKRFPYTNHMDVDLLPSVDAVLISHDHYDHLDYQTILKLRDKVQRFYVPLSVGAHLEKWGIPSENIIELNWWESTTFQDLELIFTPSRHFSGRGLTDRFSTLWGSWIIHGKRQKIFYGGDSGYFPGFKEIGDKYGPFDITFLECGAYNDNWSEIHMKPEETVQASIDLKGKKLMPIHWGKFNLALHPWKEPIERAVRKGNDLGVTIVTPGIGDIITLNDSLKTPYWWKNYN